jgi:hypothetical protein
MGNCLKTLVAPSRISMPVRTCDGNSQTWYNHGGEPTPRLS